MACGGCGKKRQKAYQDNKKTVTRGTKPSSKAARDYLEMLKKVQQRNNR